METINKYLNSKTEHALLINGKWGSGKTYYIKNKLQELIESPIEWQIIYTSGNGINDFKEILDQIFTQKYLKNITKNRLPRIALSLLKAGTAAGLKFLNLEDNAGIDRFDLLFNLENSILIIDDIERINFNRLHISDFLGTINNSFTEQSNIKVILLTDEEQLYKILNTETDKYKLIKEKTIWRTINFKFDFEPAFKSFVKDLPCNNDIKTEVLIHQEYIHDLTKISDTENLRNIKFYIEILTEIIQTIGPDNFKKISQQLLQSTFIICKEFKDGRISPENYINPADYIKFSRTAFEILLEKNQNPNKEINQELNIGVIYKNILDSLGNNYIYIEPLYHLITTGTCDYIALTKQVKSIIKNQNVETDWNKSLNKVRNFREISTAIFEQNYNQVLNFIECGKYDIYSIVIFLNFSIYFIDNDIKIKFNNIDELISFIKSNLVKSDDSPNFEDLDLDEFRKKTISKYPVLESLINEIELIHINKINKFFTLNSIDSLNKMLNDSNQLKDGEFVNMLKNIPKDNLEPLFTKYLNDPLFPNKFIDLVERSKHYFRMNEYKENKDKLLYIHANLEIRTQSTDSINKFHLKKLKKLIDDNS